MIVCVSHSGTWEDESKSEDENLAKAVPELDLILSGHTHTTLEEPIVHGDTYVVSCGEYGKNLGELSMTQKADGRWEMTSYEIVPVTTDIDQDAETQNTIDQFMDTVDTDYLAQFGYTKDQVLAEMTWISPHRKIWKIFMRNTTSAILCRTPMCMRWKMQPIMTVFRWMLQSFQVERYVILMQR